MSYQHIFAEIGDGYSTAPRGARPMKDEVFNPDIQGQQFTVANFSTGRALAELRRQNISDRKIAPHLKMGETLDYDGAPYRMLDVRPLDTLFTYSTDVLASERDVMVQSKAAVFAAWNGYAVPDGTTYEEFRDGFRPLAFASTAYHYDPNIDQPDAGVAGYVGGSASFYYRALPEDEVFPGDLLCARPPHIDPAVRQQEIDSLPRNNRDFPPERLSAIYYPLSFQDSHHFLQQELTDSLNVALTASYTPAALLPRSNQHATASRKAVIALRQLILTSYLMGTAVMQAYGFDRPYVPNDLNGLDSARFRTVGSDTLKLGEALASDYQDAGNGLRQRAAAHRSPQQAQEHLRRVAESIKFRAAKLNLLGAVQDAAGCDATNHLANAIVGCVVPGLLTSQKMQQTFDLAHFFPAAERDDSHALAPAYSPNRRPRLETAYGRLRFMLRSNGQQFLALSGVATQRMLNSVVAMMLTNTRSGEKGVFYK